MIGKIVGIVLVILLVAWLLQPGSFATVQHLFNHVMNQAAAAVNGHG
jgi:hypothetical protein